MSMALKKDVQAACRQAGTQKPVDLVHLSSVTMGDRALEREILAMFEAQIPEYLEKARDCSTETAVKRMAHTIKGAARSVGAFQLAEFAKDCEETGKFDIDALEDQLTAVAKYVSSLH